MGLGLESAFDPGPGDPRLAALILAHAGGLAGQPFPHPQFPLGMMGPHPLDLMQTSGLVPEVPMAQHPIPVPGSNFGDRLALGLDSVLQSMPGVDPYSSAGSQFAQAALRGAAGGFSRSREADMNQRQKYLDQLDANARAKNERNARLTDALTLEHAKSDNKTRQEAVTALPVPAWIANMIGRPEMVGQRVPLSQFTQLREAAEGKARADKNENPRPTSSGGSSTAGTARADSARYNRLQIRLSQMDTATSRDLATLGDKSHPLTEAVRKQITERIQQREKDRAGVQAQIESMDASRGGGRAPAPKGTAAAPAAAPAAPAQGNDSTQKAVEMLRASGITTLAGFNSWLSSNPARAAALTGKGASLDGIRASLR